MNKEKIMRKGFIKKGLFLWLACFMVSLCFAPAQAKAATNAAPKVAKKIVYYRSTWTDDKKVTVKNVGKGKIISVKSSNPDVVEIDSSGRDDFEYIPYENGVSNITIKVKKNKKVYTLKTTLIVKDAKPVQYLKVDGKNIFDTDRHGFFTVKDKKSKHKVSWKLAKGWKLVFAKYSDQENWIWYDSARSFKNGKYVPNTKKGSWLQIRVKDSKGVEYKLDIHFGGNRKYY